MEEISLPPHNTGDALEEILLSFSSSAHAIAAEHLLLAGGLEIKVMPLPAEVQAGCGICLRLAPASLSMATELLQQNGEVEFTVYTRSVQNGKSRYAVYDEATDSASL